jgi:hypothetical protein
MIDTFLKVIPVSKDRQARLAKMAKMASLAIKESVNFPCLYIYLLFFQARGPPGNPGQPG